MFSESCWSLTAFRNIVSSSLEPVFILSRKSSAFARIGRIGVRSSWAATLRNSCCCTSCLWRDLTISDIEALLSLSRYEPLTTGSRIASAILFAVSEAIASCWVRTLSCRVPAEVSLFIRTRPPDLAEEDLDDGVLLHDRLDFDVARC